MKILSALLLALMAASFHVSAGESRCKHEGVVVVEMRTSDQDAKINGQVVRSGMELGAIREACAAYMVVLLVPEATLRDLLDFGFIASKAGFDEKSGNYLAFVYSADRSRMTILKSMATVRYSDDRETLEGWVKQPPVVDDYF